MKRIAALLVALSVALAFDFPAFGAGSSVFDIRTYGAKCDGVSDDATAIQTALTAAGALTNGGTVQLPAGDCMVKAALTKAANVRLVGAGMFASILRCDGAHDCIREVDAGPTFANSGAIEELRLIGQNGALVGINIAYRQQVNISRVRISGFTQQGIYLNHTIMSLLQHCQLSSNGDASTAQIEVDNSTTFHWSSNYISGSNAATAAGLRIDRTNGINIVGGAVESTGLPIQIASKTEGTSPVQNGVVSNLDMENPNHGAVAYIEAGAGWTGAAGQGARRLVFLGVNGSLSGSTTGVYGVRFTNTDTIYFGQSNLAIPNAASGGISEFELLGTGNIRWSLGIYGPMSDNALSYVRVNATARADARSDQPWEMGGRTIVYSKKSFALNSATPDVSGYSYASTNSAIATAITNITGGVDGQELWIYAGDVNTTLNHNAAGTGKLVLRGSANLALTSGRVYTFIYDGVAAAWVQNM